jgi:hypothetical protein
MPTRAKTLEENFAYEKMRELCICEDCFHKRFSIETKKSSGYGGTIYELEQKGQPRFGLGSKSFTCLKCAWVAWTEEGLLVHMKHKHE